jgi:hypothetical protein
MASKESRYSTKKSISEAVFDSGNCGIRACWFLKEIAPGKVTWAICVVFELYKYRAVVVSVGTSASSAGTSCALKLYVVIL